MRRLIFIAIAAAFGLGFSPFTDPDSRVEEARRAYQAGEYEDAARLFASAVSEDADLAENPTMALNLGSALYRMEDYENAYKVFSSALAAPDNETRALAYYNLGTTALAMERLDNAAEAFSKSLALDPNNLSAKYNLEYTLKQIELQKQNECDNPQEGEEGEEKEKQEPEESEGSESKEQEQEGQQAKPEEEKADEEEIENILNSLADRGANPLSLQMMNIRQKPFTPEKDW